MDLTFLPCSQLSIPTFSSLVAFPEHLLFLCLRKTEAKSLERLFYCLFSLHPGKKTPSSIFLTNFHQQLSDFHQFGGLFFSPFLASRMCVTALRDLHEAIGQRKFSAIMVLPECQTSTTLFVPLSQLQIKKIPGATGFVPHTEHHRKGNPGPMEADGSFVLGSRGNRSSPLVCMSSCAPHEKSRPNCI